MLDGEDKSEHERFDGSSIHSAQVFYNVSQLVSWSYIEDRQFIAMSAKRFTLTLIRHGQTTHNKLKIIQGQMETHLTDLGRLQAKQLSEYLVKAGLKYDRVYSSDLIRAFETCQIVCGGRYEITTNQKLRERSFGVLQGSPLSMLKKEALNAGFDDSNFTSYRPEGGETMEEVYARIESFCKDDLFPNSPDASSIMIVTHGGVIREFMKLFQKIGCKIESRDFIITPNTAMNVFEISVDEQGYPVVEIQVKSIHQISHLSDSAMNEAVNEEQLNTTKEKKREVEYAI